MKVKGQLVGVFSFCFYCVSSGARRQVIDLVAKALIQSTLSSYKVTNTIMGTVCVCVSVFVISFDPNYFQRCRLQIQQLNKVFITLIQWGLNFRMNCDESFKSYCHLKNLFQRQSMWPRNHSLVITMGRKKPGSTQGNERLTLSVSEVTRPAPPFQVQSISGEEQFVGLG